MRTKKLIMNTMPIHIGFNTSYRMHYDVNQVFRKFFFLHNVLNKILPEFIVCFRQINLYGKVTSLTFHLFHSVYCFSCNNYILINESPRNESCLVRKNKHVHVLLNPTHNDLTHKLIQIIA